MLSFLCVLSPCDCGFAFSEFGAGNYFDAGGNPITVFSSSLYLAMADIVSSSNNLIPFVLSSSGIIVAHPSLPLLVFDSSTNTFSPNTASLSGDPIVDGTYQTAIQVIPTLLSPFWSSQDTPRRLFEFFVLCYNPRIVHLDRVVGRVCFSEKSVFFMVCLSCCCPDIYLPPSP